MTAIHVGRARDLTWMAACGEGHACVQGAMHVTIRQAERHACQWDRPWAAAWRCPAPPPRPCGARGPCACLVGPAPAPAPTAQQCCKKRRRAGRGRASPQSAPECFEIGLVGSLVRGKRANETRRREYSGFGRASPRSAIATSRHWPHVAEARRRHGGGPGGEGRAPSSRKVVCCSAMSPWRQCTCGAPAGVHSCSRPEDRESLCFGTILN